MRFQSQIRHRKICEELTFIPFMLILITGVYGVQILTKMQIKIGIRSSYFIFFLSFSHLLFIIQSYLTFFVSSLFFFWPFCVVTIKDIYLLYLQRTIKTIDKYFGSTAVFNGKSLGTVPSREAIIWKMLFWLVCGSESRWADRQADLAIPRREMMALKRVSTGVRSCEIHSGMSFVSIK